VKCESVIQKISNRQTYCPARQMTQVMRQVSSVCIPNSLRTIGPFLEEAQSIMRQKGSKNQKVIIYCIDHALKLVGQFGLVIGKFHILDSKNFFPRFYVLQYQFLCD
jgi:hypothetical protein